MSKMSMPSSTLPPAPWYRHRWPWLLMIGPGWVLCAGVAVGYLAFSRPDAMVVDDYYAQGKAINQDLRRDREAAAREIAVTLVYEEEGVGARLRGSIGAMGQPLATRLHLRLVHPTQPAKDIALTVTADANGRFAVLLPRLEATRWQVQVEGEQRDWRLAREWRRPATAGAQTMMMGTGAPADVKAAPGVAAMPPFTSAHARDGVHESRNVTGAVVGKNMPATSASGGTGTKGCLSHVC